MAQTPAQRRAAQRKVAAQLRRGESPLGGEFRRYVQQSYENMAATDFTRQESTGEVIPLTYRPTNTTWPGNGWDHRRTTAAGYDRETETLQVQFFTNGARYNYYGVPENVARAFRRAESPGIFINRILNNYSYERVD